MKAKRILVVSDLHCGAASGLTPKQWLCDESPAYAAAMWKWYRETVQDIGDVDILVCNGDAVDGEGKKENITQITSDTHKQAEIAAVCLKLVQAGKRFLTYGTPYHTVGTYSYEESVADLIDAEIRETLYLEVNGVRFSFRHTVGTAGTPYGQPTMLGKALVADLISAMSAEQDPADWIIRSHTHVCCEVGLDGRRARITPALQAPDGVFGRRLTQWYYHIGMLQLDVDAQGRVVEQWHLLPLKLVKHRDWLTA